MLRRGSDAVLPLVDKFECLAHDRTWIGGRAIREPADKLIEEVLGCDLKVERIAAILDQHIEQLCESRSKLTLRGGPTHMQT